MGRIDTQTVFPNSYSRPGTPFSRKPSVRGTSASDDSAAPFPAARGTFDSDTTQGIDPLAAWRRRGIRFCLASCGRVARWAVARTDPPHPWTWIPWFGRRQLESDSVIRTSTSTRIATASDGRAAAGRRPIASPRAHSAVHSLRDDTDPTETGTSRHAGRSGAHRLAAGLLWPRRAVAAQGVFSSRNILGFVTVALSFVFVN
jgi:hypothetical protein